MNYEFHSYEDGKLKIIFHYDHIMRIEENPDDEIGYLHWHSAPEILFFTEGTGYVRMDGERHEVKAGEIAVISGDQLHMITAKSKECRYYCLIPDVSFCPFGARFPTISTNNSVLALFRSIVEEYEKKRPYFQEIVSGYVGSLLALLAREYSDELPEKAVLSQQLRVVRMAVQYINRHFTEDITTQDVCHAVGLSETYLCHVFRQVTGQTILQLLNCSRCNHARTLLATGKYNVTQSALASGFTNISYFSKTYRRLIGHLPNEEIQNK